MTRKPPPFAQASRHPPLFLHSFSLLALFFSGRSVRVGGARVCAAQPVRLYSRGGGGGAPREKREGAPDIFPRQVSHSTVGPAVAPKVLEARGGPPADRKKRKTRTHTRKGFPSVKVFLEALTSSPSEKSPFRFDCRRRNNTTRYEQLDYASENLKSDTKIEAHPTKKNSLFPLL